MYVMHLADGAMCENCAKQQVATSCKVPLIDNHVEFYKDGKWLTFCASWQDQQCSSFVPYIRYHGSPVATTRLFRGLHINISSEYLQRICISLNAIMSNAIAPLT
jgi:hypothetical protein